MFQVTLKQAGAEAIEAIEVILTNHWLAGRENTAADDLLQDIDANKTKVIRCHSLMLKFVWK